MSKFYDTAEFKKLQADWDSKLKDSGFKDIEDRNTSSLVADHAAYETRCKAESKTEYFRYAGFFLNEHKFSNSFERTVWERHACGMSMRNIAKSLNRPGRKVYKEKILEIITRLRDVMKHKYLLEDVEDEL